MDVKLSLRDARVRRVAVVDDDLATTLATKDLLKTDPHIADVFADANDPDLQDYIACLRRMKYAVDEIADLATPLANEKVRDVAPDRLRVAAENALRARQGNAASVERVINLLRSSGIRASQIDRYGTPAIPAGKFYDLLIVDYYLVNDSVDETLPFIEKVVQAHNGQGLPLQVILMSSHEASLRQEFPKLRPQLRVSSSRMRVLAKPQDDAALSAWKLSLTQLATDRAFVKPIESFARAAGEAFEDAAKKQAQALWGLDLQAMHLLHATAAEDHDDYSRYVEECLSRMLLARLEEVAQLRTALDDLRRKFEANGASTVISAGSEIGDSRASIRQLMTSVVWRGGHGAPATVPRKKALRSAWAQGFLRFGMVLRDAGGQLWLHMTQSCDLAQAKADLPELNLLFIKGQLGDLTSLANGSRPAGLIQLAASMSSESTELITWNLRRIFTPSVSEFADLFAKGWTLVGELRHDQAQSVAIAYGAQAARVGLQRTVRTWTVDGMSLPMKELAAAAEDDPFTGFAVSGQAVKRGVKCELHFEIAAHSALQMQFPGAIGDSALRLCSGVTVTQGGQSDGEPYLVYLDAMPATYGTLEKKIPSNWKNKDANKDKIVMAVWPKK